MNSTPSEKKEQKKIDYEKELLEMILSIQNEEQPKYQEIIPESILSTLAKLSDDKKIICEKFNEYEKIAFDYILLSFSSNILNNDIRETIISNLFHNRSITSNFIEQTKEYRSVFCWPRGIKRCGSGGYLYEDKTAPNKILLEFDDWRDEYQQYTQEMIGLDGKCLDFSNFDVKNFPPEHCKGKEELIIDTDGITIDFILKYDDIYKFDMESVAKNVSMNTKQFLKFLKYQDNHDNHDVKKWALINYLGNKKISFETMKLIINNNKLYTREMCRISSYRCWGNEMEYAFKKEEQKQRKLEFLKGICDKESKLGCSSFAGNSIFEKNVIRTVFEFIFDD